ncbi:MAG: T9SS type A sorting domain-containing protein [Bacteroidia bacterium]
MKNKLLTLLVLFAIDINAYAQGTWTYTVQNAYSIGCPGHICINGPVTGYTFQINSVTGFGPIIPGNCGDVEFAEFAGVYNVTITQTSSGTIIQTLNNIVINQPAICGLQLDNPNVVYGCYNHNSLSFIVDGNFCGGTSIQMYKDNVYQYQTTTNGVGYQFISNLTPGLYTFNATDFGGCTASISITVNNICAAPDSGFATTNITKTSAKVNWSIKPCAVGYSVQYRKKNTTVWTTTNVGSNKGFKFISGLTAGTIYQWRVKAKCNFSPVSNSAWSAFHSFKTLLPREGFEDDDDALSAASINVFPNPATSTVNIESDFGLDENVKLSLTDINGREIQIGFTRNSENEITADIAPVANGIYQLKLANGNSVLVKKLAVVK